MQKDMEDYVSDDLMETQDLTSPPNNFDPSSSIASVRITSIPTSLSEHPENPLSSFIVDNSIKDSQSTEQPTDISSEICVCRGNIQWTWDHQNKSDNVEILSDNVEVTFNRKYSNGTAVVRCTEPMSNHQYYWEVKMNYPVYGTDIMIGVGTPEAEIAYLSGYVSRLGMDEQTWGFSRHGSFHHNRERKSYAEKFDQGNAIGLHLDLWKGTLSFYKDRKYLGVACSGLKDKTLYAMASSTAACSGMRIIHASCFPSSLQFLCAVKLRELVPDDKNVLDVIDVPPGLKQFLQTNLSWLLNKSDVDENFKTCCNESNNKKLDEDIAPESMYLLLSPFLGRNAARTEAANKEDFPEKSPKRPRTSD